MNAQKTSAVVQNDESIIEDNKQSDLFTVSPEMLNIVGGGEGMICIH